MAFIPPRCPNQGCEQHTNPLAKFWHGYGRYRTECRKQDEPRFRCTSCGRTFSRQTFRVDYREHRPDVNVRLFMLLISGVGLRQSARVLDIDLHTVLRKLAKMAQTLSDLHANLSPQLPKDRCYLLDEEETFEGASIRPLTMPVLIEHETWFVVGTGVGSIRRLAKAGSARRKEQMEDEALHGRRPDHSRARVQEVMEVLASKAPTGSIVLRTDMKSSYATIARKVFGERLTHETTSGRDPRTTYNPLFAINTTMAMTRDNMGRLRRRSWLVTKRAERLRQHLMLFTAYRNYVRRRFNHDPASDTPAKLLRLVPRQLHRHELFTWRQDWGALSIHPLSTAPTVRSTIGSLAHAMRSGG